MTSFLVKQTWIKLKQAIIVFIISGIMAFTGFSLKKVYIDYPNAYASKLEVYRLECDTNEQIKDLHHELQSEIKLLHEKTDKILFLLTDKD